MEKISKRFLSKTAGINLALIGNGTFDERRIELQKLDLLIVRMKNNAGLCREQVKLLEQMLGEKKRESTKVIFFELGDAELLKRLTGRRVCKKCGMMYHVMFNPPVNEGLCNKCGGELYQRDDDKEDVIKARMEVYKKDTEPVVRHYEKKGVLKTVNAMGSEDQIYQKLEEALK
jgi:adenylate kinase